MASGASATNSAASLRFRSGSLVAQRTSIRTLRPTAHPASCKPCRNAARRACPSGSSAARFMTTPMRRARSGCCARAVSGHAAAPPRSVMNARRLMGAYPRPKGSADYSRSRSGWVSRIATKECAAAGAMMRSRPAGQPIYSARCLGGLPSKYVESEKGSGPP